MLEGTNSLDGAQISIVSWFKLLPGTDKLNTCEYYMYKYVWDEEPRKDWMSVQLGLLISSIKVIIIIIIIKILFVKIVYMLLLIYFANMT